MTGRAATLALPLLLACGSSGPPPPPPSPVTVEAAAEDRRRLAGNWLGEFQSDDAGRRGTIAFRLTVESDTAFGNVTLDTPPQPAECVDMVRPGAPSALVAPIVLRLGGLAASGLSVGGWMRPYLDPEAGCLVDTWFEGQLRQDMLTGTYFSRRSNADSIRTGTWWAARRSR